MKRNFCREDAEEEAAAIPHSREGLEVIRLQGLLARRPTMHGTMDVGLVGLDQATDAVLLQAIEQARRDMVTHADVCGARPSQAEAY